MRGLRIVIACLALGVAVIAAVGTLHAAIARGLAEDGRRLLGGDLEIQSGAQPIPDGLPAWLAGRGARVSAVTGLRSMLIAPSGERQLVELKAVDAAWPLVGQAVFDPPHSPAAALAVRDGVPAIAVDPVVMDRLGVHPGDVVRLGTASFALRAALRVEPDRVATAGLLGPRALIAAAALPATGLIQPGAMLTHALRVVLAPGEDAARLAGIVRGNYPGAGLRVRTAGEATPGVARFLDQTGLFLTLVGLTALLVGGIGVANGVRAWLEARSATIATLRCLGASGGLIFRIYLIQVMALAGLGVALGLLAGGLLPLALAGLLGDALPVPPRLGIYPLPLALAAGYGMLTATAFALWPLARAGRIGGAALFRDRLSPIRVAVPRRFLAATLALVAALVGLTVLTAPDRVFALSFCAAVLVTLGLFRAGASLLMAAAAHLASPRLPPWARLGLANLHRPGAGTPMLLVSVGLGLATLATVALIEGNLRRQIQDQLPAAAPTFYFIDIQNDKMAAFRAVLAGQPGVSDLHEVPSLRARVVAVKGVPVDQLHVTPDSEWALRGDRGLTYAAAPPEGTRIVAGAWWPPGYAGPPLLSFDAGLAKGWGVGLGDRITLNVLGRTIEFTIASLRDIAWRSLSLNFVMVASPGLLAAAPHTHIATVRVVPAAQGAVLRAVTDALPNVSGIRVEDVLGAIAALLGQIAMALAATGSLTLAAGALVLAGAIAAGQARRVREAVVLKTLGATRRQIRAAWLVEFGALGLTAGLIAAVVGAAASFAVMHWLMGSAWSPLPGTLAATLAGCLALMLALGQITTAAALRARPARLLRNE